MPAGPLENTLCRPNSADPNGTVYIRQHYGEIHRPRSRQHAYHSAAFARGHERGGDVSLTAARALHGGEK